MQKEEDLSLAGPASLSFSYPVPSFSNFTLFPLVSLSDKVGLSHTLIQSIPKLPSKLFYVHLKLCTPYLFL